MYDSSSDEDDTPKIKELTGEEDFVLWEAYATLVLKINGLDGFIKGTETPPIGNTTEDMKKLAIFEHRKMHAYNLLYKSVQSFLARKDVHIRGYGPYEVPEQFDPKELWDELQRWYTKVTPKQKLAYLRELTTIDYRQFDDINGFVYRAEWLQRRLGRLGMPVSDEMMKTCLYGGLFPHHPSQTLERLIITRYHEWDSDKMILEIRRNSHAIQEEVKRQQREQQGTNRRRNANGQSSGHRGGSRQRGHR